MSGVNLPADQASQGRFGRDGTVYPGAGRNHSDGFGKQVDEIARLGGTRSPCVKIAAFSIYLKVTVKSGMTERFQRLRAIGIKTVMCTGDNPLTAATIAREAVWRLIPECRPEDKIDVIKREQHRAGSCHDWRRHQRAPALAQAKSPCDEQRHHRSQGSRQHGRPGFDPTKILEVVEIGKQLLITRGSLTTFSIANDIAKFFTIIPAMFMMAIPQLGVLNIMRLATPLSAVLSALIFNAVIIPCLIPLAMKGVKYRPMSSEQMLLRNMAFFGVGGVITPFIGIKLIDLLIQPLLGVLGL
jgi:K+-transporting ATPase ATPase B chain